MRNRSKKVFVSLSEQTAKTASASSSANGLKMRRGRFENGAHQKFAPSQPQFSTG